jgi:diguanylate cyclase
MTTMNHGLLARLGRRRLSCDGWRVYLGVVSAVILVYLWTHNDGFESIVYNGHGTVAAGIVGLCTWRRQPMARNAWYLIAAGLGLMSTGDWIMSGYQWVGHQDAPFPSLADPAYLAGTALLALGMWRLVAARGTTRGDLQDTGIVTLTVGLFTWVQVLGPSWESSDLLARLVAIAYPLCSALLVAAAFRLLLGRMGRSPAALLIAAGMVAELVADTVYARQAISGSYVSGGWLDVGWMAP